MADVCAPYRKGESYDAPEYAGVEDGEEGGRSGHEDDDDDDDDYDVMMEDGVGSRGWVAAAAREQAAQEAKEAAAGDGGVDWDRVVEDTLARAEPDCPICFAPLQRADFVADTMMMMSGGGEGNSSEDGKVKEGGEDGEKDIPCGQIISTRDDGGRKGGGGGGGGGMGLAWLDCSHCFHWECLSAFESYNAAIGRERSCPMCRCNYKRRRM